MMRIVVLDSHDRPHYRLPALILSLAETAGDISVSTRLTWARQFMGLT